MSAFKVALGCGDRTCEARIVAWLMAPDDPGRADPCAECVAAVNLALDHWREDRDRMLRSASAVLTSGRW